MTVTLSLISIILGISYSLLITGLFLVSVTAALRQESRYKNDFDTLELTRERLRNLRDSLHKYMDAHRATKNELILTRALLRQENPDMADQIQRSIELGELSVQDGRVIARQAQNG